MSFFKQMLNEEDVAMEEFGVSQDQFHETLFEILRLKAEDIYTVKYWDQFFKYIEPCMLDQTHHFSGRLQ